MSEKIEVMTAEQLDTISNRLHHVPFGRWGHGYSLLTRCNVITCDGNHIILFLHPDPFKNERIMEFVAHSRQDMRALLDEVARLQAENQRLESEAAQLAEFLSYIDGSFSGCSSCQANLEWLDFECPHKQEKTAFGCNDYEADCWRAAARKGTSKEGEND